MALKPTTLSFTEIVLGSDTNTLRKALQAREDIDKLLIERENAYRLIAELEGKIEDILGDETEYPYPPPPEPVFAYNPTAEKAKVKKPLTKPTATAVPSNVAKTSLNDDPIA